MSLEAIRIIRAQQEALLAETVIKIAEKRRELEAAQKVVAETNAAIEAAEALVQPKMNAAYAARRSAATEVHAAEFKEREIRWLIQATVDAEGLLAVPGLLERIQAHLRSLATPPTSRTDLNNWTPALEGDKELAALSWALEYLPARPGVRVAVSRVSPDAFQMLEFLGVVKKDDAGEEE